MKSLEQSRPAAGNMAALPNLSVIIIAGAEEHNIDACLESVSFAGEIIALCSSVTDSTAERAKRFTPHVYFREFDGYATQKRAALERATKEWVLSIDADERVPESLQEEIREAVTASSDIDGYFIPRKNIVRGVWLRHGGNYPDHQFRLFRRTQTTVTDRLVHEGFEVPGKRGYMKRPMLHYTLPNIRHMLSKNLNYAMYEAQEKQHRRKVGVLDFLLRPSLAFVQKYFFAGGFRDGWMGFIYSLIHSLNKLQVQMYMWELQHPVTQEKRKG